MNAGRDCAAVLAALDDAGREYELQRDDAERLAQPGTAQVFDEALTRTRAARAAVAEVYAQRDALVDAGKRWVRAALASDNGITADEKSALDAMIAALARCGGTQP